MAGVCALLLQHNPRLTPAAVRDIVEQTAEDVVKGRSNKETGGVAGKSRDNATGYGLVQADKALAYARRTGASPAPPAPAGDTRR